MDPISDMLNRIRNAQAVGHPTVEIPFSDLKYEIAKIMEKQGFLAKAEKKGKKLARVIEVDLKYDNKIPAISGLKRISRQGQRIYKGFKELRPVRSGYGITIISTPKGLMTDKEARKQRLGGEVLCEVW